MDREAQQRIMREDAMRRHLREQAEAEAFVQAHTPSARSARGTLVNPELVRGIGVISPPPRVRVSESSWTRGMRGRTVGIADADSALGTMLVTRDGETSVVSVASVRHTRRTRRASQAPQAQQADTARVSHGHNFADE